MQSPVLREEQSTRIAALSAHLPCQSSHPVLVMQVAESKLVQSICRADGVFAAGAHDWGTEEAE